MKVENYGRLWLSKYSQEEDRFYIKINNQKLDKNDEREVQEVFPNGLSSLKIEVFMVEEEGLKKPKYQLDFYSREKELLL